MDNPNNNNTNNGTPNSQSNTPKQRKKLGNFAFNLETSSSPTTPITPTPKIPPPPKVTTPVRENVEFVPKFRPNKSLAGKTPKNVPVAPQIKKPPSETVKNPGKPKDKLWKQKPQKFTPRTFYTNAPITPSQSNTFSIQSEELPSIKPTNLDEKMDVDTEPIIDENLEVKKKKKKKDNVIDFYEIDDGKKENAPIVTPWNNPYLHLFNETKLRVPFPKNSPAHELFYNENGERLGDGTLFLVQLPSILPNKKMAQTFKKNEEVALENLRKKSTTHRYSSNPPTFSSCLNSLENGKMGKMIIYKSGKIKLKLGDCLFDISQGTSTKFHQEAVCVSPNTSDIHFFGDVLQTMVVTPNIGSLISGKKADVLLQQEDEEALKGGLGDLMEDEAFLKPVSLPVKKNTSSSFVKKKKK